MSAKEMNLSEMLFNRDERLVDLITNLQEELDRCVKANVILDDENAELQGKITNLQEKYEEADNDRHKLFEQKEKAIEDIDLVIELIKQQPTEDDTWILNRLNGFKYLLQGSDKDE